MEKDVDRRVSGSTERRVLASAFYPCLIVNLVIGYLAFGPFVLVGVAVGGGLLERLGWSDGNSSVDDGAFITLLLAMIGFVPLLCAFLTINYLVQRRSIISAGQYWLISTATVFVPVLLVLPINAICGVTPWSVYELLKS